MCHYRREAVKCEARLIEKRRDKYSDLIWQVMSVMDKIQVMDNSIFSQNIAYMYTNMKLGHEQDVLTVVQLGCIEVLNNSSRGGWVKSHEFSSTGIKISTSWSNR